MSGFKEPSFADRQKAAQEARKNILNKFRTQPGPDDPAVKARQAEREALAAERAKAALARERARAKAPTLPRSSSSKSGARRISSSWIRRRIPPARPSSTACSSAICPASA